MSQTLEAARLVAGNVPRSEDNSDQTKVLMFCAVGIAVSLIALLLAAGWLFQPQDLLQLP